LETIAQAIDGEEDMNNFIAKFNRRRVSRTGFIRRREVRLLKPGVISAMPLDRPTGTLLALIAASHRQIGPVIMTGRRKHPINMNIDAC
jgi:hypothetical protein